MKTCTNTSPSRFSKRPCNGEKKIAAANEFAFFRCRSICTGRGGGRIKQRKSKSAFRPVPVPKSTFPDAATRSEFSLSRSELLSNYVRQRGAVCTAGGLLEKLLRSSGGSEANF